MYTEKTRTISDAMIQLFHGIQGGNGIANVACLQAAKRLDDLHDLCSEMAEQLDGIVVDAVEAGCDDPMPAISEVLKRWRKLGVTE